MNINQLINSSTGKFIKAFLTVGGASLTAFLQSNGCQLTNLKEFAYSAALGVIGGVVHVGINKYFPQTPAQ